MPDNDTRISELKDAWAKFVAAREWDQFHSPKNLVMALAAESAELMEHFLWIDNDASRTIVRDPAVLEAVCDEIAGRGEFTSAFMGLAGSAATGAYQALFEYQSLMSELLGLDITPLPRNNARSVVVSTITSATSPEK